MDGLSAAIIEETQEFWQRRTGLPVSEDDAAQAIRNVSAFFDLLAGWDRDIEAQRAQEERH